MNKDSTSITESGQATINKIEYTENTQQYSLAPTVKKKQLKTKSKLDSQRKSVSRYQSIDDRTVFQAPSEVELSFFERKRKVLKKKQELLNRSIFSNKPKGTSSTFTKLLTKKDVETGALLAKELRESFVTNEPNVIEKQSSVRANTKPFFSKCKSEAQGLASRNPWKNRSFEKGNRTLGYFPHQINSDKENSVAEQKINHKYLKDKEINERNYEDDTSEDIQSAYIEASARKLIPVSSISKNRNYDNKTPTKHSTDNTDKRKESDNNLYNLCCCKSLFGALFYSLLLLVACVFAAAAYKVVVYMSPTVVRHHHKHFHHFKTNHTHGNKSYELSQFNNLIDNYNKLTHQDIRIPYSKLLMLNYKKQDEFLVNSSKKIDIQQLSTTTMKPMNESTILKRITTPTTTITTSTPSTTITTSTQSTVNTTITSTTTTSTETTPTIKTTLSTLPSTTAQPILLSNYDIWFTTTVAPLPPGPFWTGTRWIWSPQNAYKRQNIPSAFNADQIGDNSINPMSLNFDDRTHPDDSDMIIDGQSSLSQSEGNSLYRPSIGNTDNYFENENRNFLKNPSPPFLHGSTARSNNIYDEKYPAVIHEDDDDLTTTHDYETTKPVHEYETTPLHEEDNALDSQARKKSKTSRYDNTNEEHAKKRHHIRRKKVRHRHVNVKGHHHYYKSHRRHLRRRLRRPKHRSKKHGRNSIKTKPTPPPTTTAASTISQTTVTAKHTTTKAKHILTTKATTLPTTTKMTTIYISSTRSFTGSGRVTSSLKYSDSDDVRMDYLKKDKQTSLQPERLHWDHKHQKFEGADDLNKIFNQIENKKHNKGDMKNKDNITPTDVYNDHNLQYSNHHRNDDENLYHTFRHRSDNDVDENKRLSNKFNDGSDDNDDHDPIRNTHYNNGNDDSEKSQRHHSENENSKDEDSVRNIRHHSVSDVDRRSKNRDDDESKDNTEISLDGNTEVKDNHIIAPVKHIHRVTPVVFSGDESEEKDLLYDNLFGNSEHLHGGDEESLDGKENLKDELKNLRQHNKKEKELDDYFDVIKSGHHKIDPTLNSIFGSSTIKSFMSKLMHEHSKKKSAAAVKMTNGKKKSKGDMLKELDVSEKHGKTSVKHGKTSKYIEIIKRLKKKIKETNDKKIKENGDTKTVKKKRRKEITTKRGSKKRKSRHKLLKLLREKLMRARKEKVSKGEKKEDIGTQTMIKSYKVKHCVVVKKFSHGIDIKIIKGPMKENRKIAYSVRACKKVRGRHICRDISYKINKGLLSVRKQRLNAGIIYSLVGCKKSRGSSKRNGIFELSDLTAQEDSDAVEEINLSIDEEHSDPLHYVKPKHRNKKYTSKHPKVKKRTKDHPTAGNKHRATKTSSSKKSTVKSEIKNLMNIINGMRKDIKKESKEKVNQKDLVNKMKKLIEEKVRQKEQKQHVKKHKKLYQHPTMSSTRSTFMSPSSWIVNQPQNKESGRVERLHPEDLHDVYDDLLDSENYKRTGDMTRSKNIEDTLRKYDDKNEFRKYNNYDEEGRVNEDETNNPETDESSDEDSRYHTNSPIKRHHINKKLVGEIGSSYMGLNKPTVKNTGWQGKVAKTGIDHDKKSYEGDFSDKYDNKNTVVGDNNEFDSNQLNNENGVVMKPEIEASAMQTRVKQMPPSFNNNDDSLDDDGSDSYAVDRYPYFTHKHSKRNHRKHRNHRKGHHRKRFKSNDEKSSDEYDDIDDTNKNVDSRYSDHKKHYRKKIHDYSNAEVDETHHKKGRKKLYVKQKQQHTKHKKKHVKHKKQHVKHKKQHVKHKKQHIKHTKKNIKHKKKHVKHEKNHSKHDQNHVHHHVKSSKHDDDDNDENSSKHDNDNNDEKNKSNQQHQKKTNENGKEESDKENNEDLEKYEKYQHENTFSRNSKHDHITDDSEKKVGDDKSNVELHNSYSKSEEVEGSESKSDMLEKMIAKIIPAVVKSVRTQNEDIQKRSGIPTVHVLSIRPTARVPTAQPTAPATKPHIPTVAVTKPHIPTVIAATKVRPTTMRHTSPKHMSTHKHTPHKTTKRPSHSVKPHHTSPANLNMIIKGLKALGIDTTSVKKKEKRSPTKQPTLVISAPTKIVTQHPKVVRLHEPSKMRILCFGDSLTAGYNAHGKNFFPYCSRLQDILNYRSTIPVYTDTKGVVGEMTHKQMTSRLPMVIGNATYQYDWIIILGGTNDILHVKNFADDQEFLNQLETVWQPRITKDIEKLHQIAYKAGARTMLLTVPENSIEAWPDYKPLLKMRQRINEALRKFAAQSNGKTVLCDIARKLPRHNLGPTQEAKLWDDHLHMTPEGYTKMAGTVADCMRPYLPHANSW